MTFGQLNTRTITSSGKKEIKGVTLRRVLGSKLFDTLTVNTTPKVKHNMNSQWKTTTDKRKLKGATPRPFLSFNI